MKITKQIANRVKEIDFISILNSEEGKKIQFIVKVAISLNVKKSDTFVAAAASYYGDLYKFKEENRLSEFEKESYLIAWVNNCLLAKRSMTDNLQIMLAGIYQFVQWEKENALST
jgi:hypothetical protein